MTLQLPEGKYHAVAYGGMECERSSFRHPSAPGADTRLADLQVEMHPTVSPTTRAVSSTTISTERSTSR